jgi:hypothetical protein
MKTVSMLVLVSLLCGCTHVSYNDPSGAQFSSTSVMSSRQIGGVKVKAGDKELTLESLSSSQAEATGTILGAALKAANK